MIRTITGSLLVALTAAGLMGCGMDALESINHPRKAGPGDEIAVNLVNVFTLFSNGSLLIQEVNRDSLHVGIGLPADWSVKSVNYYVASDINVFHMIDILEDTTQIEAMVAESMQVYASRSTPMTVDEDMASYFSGKEFPIGADTSDTAETIHGDSVDQWLAFGAEIGLNFPVLSRMDTVFAIEDSADTGGMLDSLLMEIDSVGVSAVPILVFAELTAGEEAGDIPLYYFSKTGPLPEGSSENSAIQFDRGMLIEETINIDIANALIGADTRTGSNPGLTAAPHGASGAIRIGLPAKPVAGTQVDVYSLEGELVHRLSPPSADFIWNGTGASGRPLPQGTYLIRWSSGRLSRSTTLRLLGN